MRTCSAEANIDEAAVGKAGDKSASERLAGGVATCGVAHRVGDGMEPLLLDIPLQAGVAGLVQAV